MPTAPIIDTHCHLDFADYEGELPDVLARARAAGLVAMVCIGSGKDVTSARAAVALAGAQPDIWASVGVHPHDAASMTEADWDELDRLAAAPRVVGIGETGLDYHYDHSPRDVQREVFRRFVALSRARRKPVICHIRDAHADAAALLTAEERPAEGGVIHCFTGTAAESKPYLDLGFFLSFSGIATFKTAADIREAISFAPLDRIVVETDAPYLAPIPYRGKRNEPSYVVKTLELVAGLKGVPFEQAAEATTANARRLFTLAG